MSSNYKFDTDVKEALTMAEGLGEYVRGNQVYGTSGSGFFSNMPSLTVGALVLRLRRLDTLRPKLTDRHIKSLDTAIDIYETIRREWTLHYEQKMTQEAHSRLDAMQAFFKECADSMQNCANVYRPELLRRTIVQELLAEMEYMKINVEVDLKQKVAGVDGKLHGVFQMDVFQWADVLQPIYPQATFWWLYQKPKVEV